MFSTENTAEAKKERQLRSKVEDIILDVARMYNDVDNSDLQGIAMVKAAEIVKIVREAK